MTLFRVPIKGEILVCAETESEAFEIAKQMMLDRLPTGYVDVGYSRPTVMQIMVILVLILVIVTLFDIIWTFFSGYFLGYIWGYI